MTVQTRYPNWFLAYANVFFERHLRRYSGQPDLQFLQIGAFTGDASVWLLDNILTGPRSRLVDVDTWEGSDEAIHTTFDWADVEAVYDARTAKCADHLAKCKMPSRVFFATKPGTYDFIYIDGDHTAKGVLEDAVKAFGLLKPGGLLAFDDYLWQSGKTDENNPGIAIDAVRSIYRAHLDLVDIGQQVWFRKR